MQYRGGGGLKVPILSVRTLWMVLSWNNDVNSSLTDKFDLFNYLFSTIKGKSYLIRGVVGGSDEIF